MFNARGIQRLTKTKPALRAGEFAIVAHVNVPKDFFDRALPRADITLPEGFEGVPLVHVDVRTQRSWASRERKGVEE